MCDAGCDAGPLSSIVWANFLASGWFVQLAHSCYFFPTCTLFLCFLSLYSYCYPNELLPFFLFLFFPRVHCYFLSCYFFPTCPLLLSFLLLFFLLVHCYFLSCYFFSYLKLLLSFLLPFFLLLSFRAPGQSGYLCHEALNSLMLIWNFLYCPYVVLKKEHLMHTRPLLTVFHLI